MVTDNAFQRIAHRIAPDSRLHQHWKLTGGVSAQITAIVLESADGSRLKIVVRQYGEKDRRANPNIAADEFRLLQILKSAGLPVPAPYFFDQSGQILPTPFIVIGFIEGQTEFSPPDPTAFIEQFSAYLTRIHALGEATADFAFLSKEHWFNQRRLEALDDSMDEGRIRAALAAVWPLSGGNKSVLLHGDYWPGNLLWRDGQLVGIVDWEDADFGDPLSDVAISRLDVLWALGPEMMQAFTAQYQIAMPHLDFGNLPYWDLCAALRPAFQFAAWAGGDDEAEKRMRSRHAWFVRGAFEALNRF